MTDKEMFSENSERIVEASQMLPFRFLQAYKACSDSGVGWSGGTTFDLGGSLLDDHTEQWLSAAIDHSARNLPDHLGNTLAVADVSGSMDSDLSDGSEMTYMEIATLFAAMCMQKGADGAVFASDFAFVENSGDLSTLEMAQRMTQASVGGATNGWKVPATIREQRREYDRVVMLTDLQLWDSTPSFHRSSGSFSSEWNDYVGFHEGDPHLYTIDLSSYGDLAMPEGYHNVHQISGWTENVLEYVDGVEQADDVIAQIAAMDPEDY